ncbi:MAG: hypothetical protein ACJAWV_002780 [Flammeovirgaceae bacterium]
MRKEEGEKNKEKYIHKVAEGLISLLDTQYYKK